MKTLKLEDKQLSTVCDKCLTAACWQGEFYCEDNKTASTCKMRVKELRKLNYENEDYWYKDVDVQNQVIIREKRKK